MVPEGERRGSFRNLVGNSEGNITPGRPRRRREDNIKKDLQEIGWGLELDCSDSRQAKWRSLLTTLMKL